MRRLALVCLAALVCSAWVLGSAEPRTPNSQPTLEPRPALPDRDVGGRAANRPGRMQTPSEQDKAVVRRVFDDLFNHGRYELIDAIYARDCRVHSDDRDTKLREAVTEAKGWRLAAPDLRMTIGELSIRGDRVLASWTAMGTHTGLGNRLRPSGNRFVVHGRSEFRVVDGRIAEVWNHWDRSDLYRQIGVNPKLGRLFDTVLDLWSAVS